MRQLIFDTVESSLKNISIEHGYKTNIGKNVFAWHDKPLNKDQFPACIVTDADMDYDDDSGHKLKIEVVVITQGGVSSEVATSTRTAMQDVATATKEAVFNLGVYGKILKSTMISEDREQRMVAGQLIIEVVYSDDEWSI